MPNSARGKIEVSSIDGTPDKRLFWSIISDYDLKTALCELIDNALDTWSIAGRKKDLSIIVKLDSEQQTISVEDDAGGVKEEDLRLLIAPGGSKNSPHSQIIGVFGVGNKRASVALGEHVEIRSRFKNQKSFQLDITSDWLELDTWDMPCYEIPSIKPSTTRIDVSRLRQSFAGADIDELISFFGEVYSWYLQNGVAIKVNKELVKPIIFEKWAYPPKFRPRRALFKIAVPELGDIAVKITAGVIRDRDPETENYGVYIYCNNRLITKELKTRDVGYFVSGEAGVPHPDASLARVIVRLNGATRAMPWNSSKNAINYSHSAFQQIRPTIIQLNTFYSSLSRRYKHNWDTKILRYKTGQIEDVNPAALGAGKKFILPKLPRMNKSRTEHLRARNKSIIAKEPWTLGLVEALGAVDIMGRQRLDTKNRISLILLDSNFEIALKEYIIHRPALFPRATFTDDYLKTLFKRRGLVLQAVRAQVTLDQDDIDKAQHYYEMRNKLIHERATVGITDQDVLTYRAVVERVLETLFLLKLR